MAEAVPAPLAAEGQVTFDPVSRSLLVKPAKGAGWAGMLWRQGHEKLRQAEETGSYVAPPTVWAHGFGRGVPVADGWVRFRVDDAAKYRELTSRPGLGAIFTVDMDERRILTVRFLNRP